jgi:hypothetical protein
MKKMTPAQFERSKFDKETKGESEGSKADKARDKKQLAAVNKKRMAKTKH